MGRYLIVYSTKYGQTEKISMYIKRKLRELGHAVDIYNVKKIPVILSPLNYDSIIIGGSVYGRTYPKKFVKWCRHYSEALKLRPSSFFSVCLGILQEDPAVKQDEIAIVNEFFKNSGWQPKIWRIFAGALPYSKYNWLIKIVMKRISKKAGFSTVSTVDYEFTDWNQVDQFILDIDARLETGLNHGL